MLIASQKKIVEMLAAGKVPKEMAAELGISYSSLIVRCQRIRKKLSAGSYSHMVAISLREGIIS